MFIAIAFILSVNSAFAIDDDGSELAIDESVSDEVIEVQSDEVVNAVEDETLSVSNDEDVLSEGSSANTVVMNGITKRYNGVIEYKATFYDSNGNPLKNSAVSLGIDSTSWGVDKVTDSNGVAIFTFEISNGNHVLYGLNYNTVSYASDNVKIFDVLTGNKNIKMYYDDGNTYSVRVFDDNGKPVKAGEKVSFKIGSKSYVKKTDKNGYAKVKITLKPGSYVMYATYKDCTVANDLTVKPVIKAKTGSVKGKSKIPFKVSFLGKNKKNKVIKVKFNKKTYKAKTNKKGVASFNLKTPKKLGKYNVVVSYKNVKEYYVYTQYYK